MASMSAGCSAAALMVSGLLLGPILAGEAHAQTIDHYQCYKAKQLKKLCQEDLTAKCKTDADCPTGICLQKFGSTNVSLTDQFGSASSEVKKPKSLCTPVEKILQGPLLQDPALHYMRYQIKGGPSVKGLRVLARDQFGDHVIELIKPDSLLVPASKSDVAVGPPAPGSNHYLCYKAKNKKKTCTDDLTTKCKADADCTQGGMCDLGFGKVPQGLMDQFGTSTVEIKKVKFFCTPAEKDNENGGKGPFNPIDHLVGYQIKGSGITATVHTNDQFGPEALALSKQEILLVPALKNPTGELICGDDVVNQPSEVCDGDDDVACPGQCQSDCTCPEPPRCGDGAVNQMSEDCDPPEDAACSGECQANCTCPGAPPRCGDGTVNQTSEQCDDGNVQNGDCCSATCQFESGSCASDGNPCTTDVCNGAGTCIHPTNSVPCNDGDACTDPDQCQNGSCVGTPLCGNNAVDSGCGEECDGTDDRNCPGQCQPDCTCLPPPGCGNNIREGTEQCDGTDDSACAGQCLSNCTCPPPPTCGDGVINQASEECDDGNTNDQDACATACTLNICGNSRLDPPENCDPSSGTNAAPVPNQTITCDGDCSFQACPDGFTNSSFGVLGRPEGEECDDGNTNNTDACDNTCLANVCGNDRTDSNEDCDDGTGTNASPVVVETASCDDDCTTPACGDLNTNEAAGEQCDDGKHCSGIPAVSCTLQAQCDLLTGGGTCEPVSNDGCSASCLFE